MSKARVAVLRGGISEEYPISLKTGSAVLNALDKEYYEPIDVIISKGGEWLLDGRVKLPEHILHSVDVVFIALHGAYGEDGTVQRLLERYHVPYTGSKPFQSAIAMNKHLTKEALSEANILLPKHVRITQDSIQNLHHIITSIIERFGPHYIIKPVASGSSFGTSIIRDGTALAHAIHLALENYSEVIVEEFIEGKEVTCGVIERFRNRDVYALPPIEIVKPVEATHFDTQLKYDGKTQEICPARFQNATVRHIEDAAIKIHALLDLSQYSRSDFILRGDDLFFLEVNTLPGLTIESLFPKALDAVGMSYADFISHLITDTLTQKT